MTACAYHIGQTMPLPVDADIDLARYLMNARRMAKWRAKSPVTNHRNNATRCYIEQAEDAQRRANDPFEIACTYLRRKGFIPVAKVNGVHVVGRQRFGTEKQVMAFAKGKGWTL